MVSRVATPIVVHADHKSLGGYRSAANSASFCKALLLSAKPSLAIRPYGTVDFAELH